VDSQKFACGLLDGLAWMRSGLITFNTNLSRFSARSHISLLVILVIYKSSTEYGRGPCRRRYRVNQDEQTWERLAHHFTLRSHLQRGSILRSVDIERMHSVEEEGLMERLELDSRPEVRRLVAQCSILVVIAGIVAGLIAA
jgi:hypothetical protein